MVACLALGAAVCAVAGSAQAEARVSVNACRYAATAPVAAVVRSHDPQGVVTFQRGCRVSVRPSFGGRPIVVLAGAAYPGNQFAGRLQLFRSGGEEEDDELTRKVITRVPRLRNAYLIREVYKEDGSLSQQLIIVKLGAKMIILSDLGFTNRADTRRFFLRPTRFFTVARLLR